MIDKLPPVQAAVFDAILYLVEKNDIPANAEAIRKVYNGKTQSTACIAAQGLVQKGYVKAMRTPGYKGVNYALVTGWWPLMTRDGKPYREYEGPEPEIKATTIRNVKKPIAEAATVERKCMCCGIGFRSEGAHNRLCMVCRNKRNEEGYSVARW